jgi:Zn finger protein HypA/HybF involved in hydrogenase expression
MSFTDTDGSTSDLWCECQDCTERWMEPRDGYGTIRCPNEDCGSKNVEIVDPDDL